MKLETPIPHRAVSPARAAAFDILVRIERESSYASELLHSRSCNRLSAVDHALTTELVMGVLRWHSLLDSKIAAISNQSTTKVDVEVLVALRLGAYQLGWLTRIPAHAAINESVELVKRARKRSAASFVNAVLRKTSREAQAAAAAINGGSVQELAATSAHPIWLVERWTNSYGLAAAARICRYNQSPPATTIRLRQTKRKPGRAIEDQLHSEDIELAPGALLSSARRVLRGDITRTSVFRDGLCVIQDEASQLVAILLGHGLRILDCCAAPGGKSGLIAENNPNSDMVAVELHPHRARLLRKLLNNPAGNAESSNIRVVSADACHLPFCTEFDRVLADVPCSGTGTVARNPEIKWRLAPEDLNDLQARQLAILRSTMNQASLGGRVVYSTCSLEKEENEDVIEQAMKEDSSFRVVDCNKELTRLQHQGVLIWPGPPSLIRGPYLRTLSGVQPCDGFFAAILEKASTRK